MILGRKRRSEELTCNDGSRNGSDLIDHRVELHTARQWWKGQCTDVFIYCPYYWHDTCHDKDLLEAAFQAIVGFMQHCSM